MLVNTALYAGILCLFSIVLSAGAGVLRGKKGIDAGDGGDPDLEIEANG